jgi:hypothetical protein
MVEAGPSSALIVAKAQFLLEFQLIALDQPAQLGQKDQPIDWGVGRQVRQPELCRLRFVMWPFGEQPVLGPGRASPVIALGPVR